MGQRRADEPDSQIFVRGTQFVYTLDGGGYEPGAAPGIQTLSCGCVTGKYREVATSREVTYVEEKGPTCSLHGHRSNHAVAPERTFARVSSLAFKAS